MIVDILVLYIILLIIFACLINNNKKTNLNKEFNNSIKEVIDSNKKKIKQLECEHKNTSIVYAYFGAIYESCDDCKKHINYFISNIEAEQRRLEILKEKQNEICKQVKQQDELIKQELKNNKRG